MTNKWTNPITTSQWRFILLGCILGVLFMGGVAWSIAGSPLAGWWWTSIVGVTCGGGAAAYALTRRP
ncbi:MAG: hypothetical protein QGI75_01560 [Phycisphaerales bacterium]|jgi:hypothetical protein|nr:hypothetical protein [Phycisphaerales bacterium]MDP6890453.1 hypothetical protein [Phycisphaerales bacterium]